MFRLPLFQVFLGEMLQAIYFFFCDRSLGEKAYAFVPESINLLSENCALFHEGNTPYFHLCCWGLSLNSIKEEKGSLQLFKILCWKQSIYHYYHWMNIIVQPILSWCQVVVLETSSQNDQTHQCKPGKSIQNKVQGQPAVVEKLLLATSTLKDLAEKICQKALLEKS